VGYFKRKISGGRRYRPPTSVGIRKRVTDGRTDRQKYDPQDRTSIAASRGKNKVYETTADVVMNDINFQKNNPLNIIPTTEINKYKKADIMSVRF